MLDAGVNAIHHIHFAYPTEGNLDSQRGFGPVASSLPAAPRRELSAKLSDYTRAEGVNRPDTSVCYLPVGDLGVVLRRTRQGYDDNRHDCCHALVGPLSTVTPRWALAVQNWQGWQDGPHDLRFSELPWSRIAEFDAGNSAMASHLEPAARQCVSGLVAMVAGLLRSPEGPVLVNATGELSLAQQHYLLWGFFDLADALLAGLADQWSFSTYESDYRPRPGSALVAFVGSIFDPMNLSASHALIDLGGGGAGDDYARRARDLVERYQSGGGERVRSYLEASGVTRATTARGRVDLLMARESGPVPGRSLPASPMALPAVEEPARSLGGQRTPPPAGGDPRLHQAVTSALDGLRRANNLDAFRRAVDELSVAGLEDRRELFRRLAEARFHVDRIRRFCQPSSVRPGLRRLVNVVLDDRGLNGELAADLNRFLADETTDPIVAQVLWERLADLGLIETVFQGLGVRYARERGLLIGCPPTRFAVPPLRVVDDRSGVVVRWVSRWAGTQPIWAARVLLSLAAILVVLGVVALVLGMASGTREPSVSPSHSVSPVTSRFPPSPWFGPTRNYPN